MSYADHQRHAPATVRVAILTVSDSRRLETDDSGRLIHGLLEDAGHDVTGHALVKDNVVRIRTQTQRLARQADVVIVNGGTGAGPRDVTPEALRPRFVKEFPGFGELFRQLSYAEIGSGAVLSRATCGLLRVGKRHVPVFLLPGSPDACRLATERLILPELGHFVDVARGPSHV